MWQSVAGGDCPFSDEVVLGPHESTFAGNDVYRACQTITLEGGYTVGPSGSVLLEAGERISFLSGVHLQEGSAVEARVGQLPESFPLEGVVRNAAVEGAAVTVFLPSDPTTPLGETLTAIDGSFSFSLIQQAPYLVRSLGGWMGGSAYSAELWGFCSGAAACFVTPWSSVQYQLVHGAGYNFDGASDLMGALGFSEDPFVDPVQPFDLVAARAAIGDGAGLAGWVNAMSAWLQDPEQPRPAGVGESSVPPVFAGLPDYSVQPGELLTFAVSATDPDGPPPLTVGAYDLPQGAAFVDHGGGNGTFTWTPSVSDLSASPHTITFTATEGFEPALTSSLKVRIDVSFIEEFDAGATNWVFVNDAPFRSMSWGVVNGALRQQNRVGSVHSFDGTFHRGTYAYLPAGGGLTDYRLTIDASSVEPNDIGVMFRFQDNDNFYRLSMNARFGFTRLEKKVGGTYVPLAVNGRGHTPGTPLEFTIEVRGSLIVVWIDGQAIFAVEDDSLPFGSVALYTQDNSSFDRVVVEGLSHNPYVVLGTPVAYSVRSSDSIEARAYAPLVQPGESVELVLDGQGTVLSDVPPYTSTFTSLPTGERVIEAIIRDTGETEVARDTSARIGVGGEYFISIGDSITYGVGDHYSRDNRSQSGRVHGVQGWQAPLVDFLEESAQRPVMVYNSGIGGDESFDAAFKRVDSILARHPGSDKALVLLGTNDTGASIPSGLGCVASGCSGTFKGNMQALIDSLNAAGKTVYVARTPPVFGSGSGTPYTNPLTAPRNTRIQQYNEVIDGELFGKHPGPDLFTYFLDGTVNRFSLFSDNLHPNALGHLAIAHLWHNSLNVSAQSSFPVVLDNLDLSTTPPFLKQNLLQEGNAVYVDRTYTLSAIPAPLEGGVWINTADNDAGNAEDLYLTFEVPVNVSVYVAYDAAAERLPDWLGGFSNTGLLVATDNPLAPSMRVYQQFYNSGTISLGGNMASGALGANAHYLVVVKPL